MTQEEKELLLKDLCGRLYTGTIVNYNDTEGCDYPLTIKTLSNFPEEKLKCYLRPMSSMTEEEEKEFLSLGEGLTYNKNTKEVEYLTDRQIWLDKNCFDYRGLISKGLALESPEDMYKN